MVRQKPETIRLHPSAPEPVRGAHHMTLTEPLLSGILAALPATVLVFDRDRKITSYSGRGRSGVQPSGAPFRAAVLISR